MKTASDPVLKDLVLIGGGHSHVSVIKSFGMNPLAGVRLTVISRDIHTPYSGMLPGFVAGHYDHDDVHIDLRPLAQFAGARLYHDEVLKIDTETKSIICRGRPPVPYDLLSINIGSSPRIQTIPGAEDFAVAVKPINRFVDRWTMLLDRVIAVTGPHKIGIVGAGAAGVEILLAIQFRLKQVLHDLGRSTEDLSFYLICKSDRIMPDFPNAVARRFDRILQERGVIVHRGVTAVGVEQGLLSLSNGVRLELDETLFVTSAGASAWLKESGLPVDENGFVKVDDTLQVLGHPEIFAAGDVACVVHHPRSKAGVFAVRQGKPLSDNLRSVLQNQQPKRFVPQKSFLALISSGDKYAVASKGIFSAAGQIIWLWKDWIDRSFMKKFSDLPKMPEEQRKKNAEPKPPMRCGGCGAKVGAGVLSRSLSKLNPVERDDVLIGLKDADDAAVLEIPAGKVLVQTVDYFRSFIDDPYLFGKICANHALSDVFAMGGEAQSALAIATLPYGIEAKVEETLNQMMAGAMEVLNDANASLIGGHSSEGAELALGFSVNGLIDKDKVLRKKGMKAGDVLILTKALGTGTLFAADMQHKAKGRWIDGALASMIQSNRIAAHCFYRHGVTACTDVTGFGLIGHLVEMIRVSDVDVEIDLNSLPLLDGALETLDLGIFSSLHPANLRAAEVISNNESATASTRYNILFDPQTAGGLLGSIPAANVTSCIEELYKLGYSQSVVIGHVLQENKTSQSMRLIF